MASISARTGRSPYAGRPIALSSAVRPGVTWTCPTALGRLRQRRGRPSFVCCASETANRKLIASSEIPLVFPREDFTLQLYRWAKIEAEANGLQNFGAPIDIQPTLKDPNAADGESELWGFDAYILRDGRSACFILPTVYLSNAMRRGNGVPNWRLHGSRACGEARVRRHRRRQIPRRGRSRGDA